MSHSSKDAVGGHDHPNRYRHFNKKWNRREARREAKATITEALNLLAADVHDDYCEMLELERIENERYYAEDYFAEEEAANYYDDWEYEDFDAFDPWNDWYDPVPHEPEPTVVAYHQLNEPIYAMGESLGEILERLRKK